MAHRGTTSLNPIVSLHLERLFQACKPSSFEAQPSLSRKRCGSEVGTDLTPETSRQKVDHTCRLTEAGPQHENVDSSVVFRTPKSEVFDSKCDTRDTTSTVLGNSELVAETEGKNIENTPQEQRSDQHSDGAAVVETESKEGNNLVDSSQADVASGVAAGGEQNTKGDASSAVGEIRNESTASQGTVQTTPLCSNKERDSKNASLTPCASENAKNAKQALPEVEKSEEKRKETRSNTGECIHKNAPLEKDEPKGKSTSEEDVGGREDPSFHQKAKLVTEQQHTNEQVPTEAKDYSAPNIKIPKTAHASTSNPKDAAQRRSTLAGNLQKPASPDKANKEDDTEEVVHPLQQPL